MAGMWAKLGAMTAQSIGALSAPAYLTALQRDGKQLIELAGSDLSTRIPTCPGWDSAALLRHMGEVYNWTANLVARRAEAPAPEDGALDEPEAGGEAAWCSGLLDRVVDILAQSDPDEPMWTWTERTTLGFYHRRMAHETAVHLADVQLGIGRPVELDSDLATDGIDEFIEMVYTRPRPPEDSLKAPAESLHLHRTDGTGEWMFSSDDGSIVVTHEHGKGDAAVRGSGPDLLLFVWGRGISPACEVFGDRSVAEAWAGLAP